MLAKADIAPEPSRTDLKRRRPLKLQATVLVATSRTMRQFNSHRPGVELIAPDTVKRGLSPLPLECLVIAAIVPQPQAKKNYRDKGTKYHRGDRQIEHARV